MCSMASTVPEELSGSYVQHVVQHVVPDAVVKGRYRFSLVSALQLAATCLQYIL